MATSHNSSTKAAANRTKTGAVVALAAVLIAGVGGIGGWALTSHAQQTAPAAAAPATQLTTMGEIVTHLGYPDIPAACADGIKWTCGAEFWTSTYSLTGGAGTTVHVSYISKSGGTVVNPGVDPATAATDPQALARFILADMPASVEEVGVVGVASRGWADREGNTR